MTWISEFLRRVQSRLWRSQLDRDLAEEIQLHLALRAEEKQAGGADREAAEAEARRQFGNATQLREQGRETWGWTILDTVAQDIRYALRALAANRGFAATAVLSLALGIGANTAIFSIVKALMLRSLPIENPQGLVQISLGQNPDDELNSPIYEQIRDRQHAFSGVVAYSADRFDLAAGGESQFIPGIWASGDFFRVLGVPAMLGRTFTADADQWGCGRSGPVAVISYAFWKRNFLGNPGVIGKFVRLNRHQFEIVGVTPPWFNGLDVDRPYNVAIPIGCQPVLNAGRKLEDARLYWWLKILARLAPGVGPQEAEARLGAITPDVLRAVMGPDRSPREQAEFMKTTFHLHPAALGFSGTRTQYRTALFALMGTVGLVLLIACANIANLLLARAAARQRELAVRMAIGASRPRVIRQLMTESLILALFGASAGFLLAIWGGRLLVQLLSTARNPIEIDISPDLGLLAYTLAIAALTALLFGLAPALRGTRLGLSHVLKENERSAVRGGTRFNLRKALVTAQVAMSLVLLVGAALFLGTLRNLLTVDPGFSRQNVLLINADVQQTAFPADQRQRVFREVLDGLRSIPGVESAATSILTPVTPEGWAQPVTPEGYPSTPPRDRVVFFNRVSSGYFKTMKTALLIGRDFDDRDTNNSTPVMIVNETTARNFFGETNPIGKTIGMGVRGSPTQVAHQIIGVVKDSKYNRLNEQNRRIGYLACSQDALPEANISFAIRTAGPVDPFIPLARSVVASVNRDISLEFRSLEMQVNDSILRPRLVALLSAIFGSLALLLAMVGLYGITSYAVTQRRSEIGIRIALGAQRTSVVWLMLRDVVALLAAGMILGLCAALAAGKLVTSLLYGVQPNDPRQFAGAAVALAVATAIAAYLPARRAARLDPAVALREE